MGGRFHVAGYGHEHTLEGDDIYAEWVVVPRAFDHALNTHGTISWTRVCPIRRALLRLGFGVVILAAL